MYDIVLHVDEQTVFKWNNKKPLIFMGYICVSRYRGLYINGNSSTFMMALVLPQIRFVNEVILVMRLHVFSIN